MFAEELFIDYVDHEFALRMRQAGYILLEATAIFLEHRIGATTRHTILGMPVKVTNHPPQRRYYMTRNRLLLYWHYGRRFPAWAINDFICMMKELVGIVLFEEQKIAKLRMMLLGMAHCLTGRRGPLPLHVARGDRSQLP
jgi:rhamnosyltransferase